MQKITLITLIFLFLLITPLISSDIIINQQPNGVYNFGDIMNFPIKIKTNADIKDFLMMKIICNGAEMEIYKEFLNVKSGEEKSINPSIPLIKSIISTTGSCKIKTILGEDFALSNEFKISDKILIELKESKKEFNPEEKIIIEGKANKETGEPVNGFIDVELNAVNSEPVKFSDSVNNGYFYLNLSIPKNEKAGEHLVVVNIYEKEGENATNKGSLDYTININQIPTNLELVFENFSVEPGTNLKVKGILRDQTGEKIQSINILTIKNKNNKIMQQKELATDEFLEYPISYKESPAEWIVVAVSNKLSAESKFKILEKMEVGVSIVNKTLEIKNIGNVPYNKTLIIKIGNETIVLDSELGVDKTQRYFLTAPDGEYNVEVIKDGKSLLSKNVFLTGNAIDLKKAGIGVVKIARHPAVWIFIIAIMGFVAYTIFRKGYQRSFIGRIGLRGGKLFPLKKDSFLKSGNRAELSLSIKGDRQEASVFCLNVKNLDEIKKTKSNAEETLQRVIDFAESNKAVTYENQENIFFIIAPVKTKTFKNEKTALNMAMKSQEMLASYNRLAKQKINFGISINSGIIVAKLEKDSFKFMSMGNLINETKKIASASSGEVLLSEKINAKLISEAKTEIHEKDGLKYYKIRELKHQGDDKKFISNFVRKYEEENRGE